MAHLKRSRLALALFGLAAALAGTTHAGRAQPVLGADIAYDQIERFLVDATAPPPGSFATDAARIAAVPPTPDSKAFAASLKAAERAAVLGSFIPGFGIAANLAGLAGGGSMKAYASGLAASLKAQRDAGNLEHVWTYHGWSRVDLVKQNARIITKPDAGSFVVLDLVGKTYHTTALSSAQPPVVPEATEAAITLAAEPVTTGLDPATLGGLPARGYRTVATFTTSSELGYCLSGVHQLTEIEYVVDVPDPGSSPGPALAGSAIARAACVPSGDAAHHEPGRFVVFRSTSITGALQGSLVNVVERDNLRALGAADESAFALPAGFTEKPEPG